MAVAVPHHEYRSLRYVRGEVQVRTGFENQISGLSSGIWNSFVREAHRELFLQLKMREQHKTSTLSTVVDQVLYTMPSDVDYRRITQVYVNYASWWIPVTRRNIQGAHDSVASSAAYPILWDIQNGQLELWPNPDAIYSMRIEHYTQERYLRDPGQSWTANTLYAVGAEVYSTAAVDYPTDWPIKENGADTVDAFIYECTTGGTSDGSTEPTWPTTDAGTVNDNGVVWTARENRMQVPSAEVMQLALFKAKSHYRQEDAQNSLQSSNLGLQELRRGETRGKRYVRRTGHRPLAEPDEAWLRVPPKMV